MNVTKLVGIEIQSRKDAKSVHRAIENREDEGMLEIAEATLVYKTERGHIKTSRFGMTGFGIGASIGGGLGMGTALALVAITGTATAGIGLLPGLAAGGFIGHFFEKHIAGKEMLKDIGEGLDAGRGYVLVATDDAGAAFLDNDSSTDGHRVAHIDITPEFIEDLEKAHTEASEAATSDGE